MAEEIHSARWQKIDDLFQAALDCAPERRDAFLDESCAGDTALRSEVEEGASFLEQLRLSDSIDRCPQKSDPTI